jgi:hypothetical protein
MTDQLEARSSKVRVRSRDQPDSQQPNKRLVPEAAQVVIDCGDAAQENKACGNITSGVKGARSADYVTLRRSCILCQGRG